MTLEEKVRSMNEAAQRMTEAIMPLADAIIKGVLAFAVAASQIKISLPPAFYKSIIIQEKKDRNRIRYYRMMERKKILDKIENLF